MAEQCQEGGSWQLALAVAFANYCRENGEAIAVPQSSKEDCRISEFPKACLQEG